MGYVKNVVEKAESMRGKIPDGYSLGSAQMMELYEHTPGDCFRLIGNSFSFGYLQGVKATKAAMKKKA